MGFRQEWVVQGGANQFAIFGHKQPGRHPARAAPGESYFFAARDSFGPLEDGFLDYMFNIGRHCGRLANAHQVKEVKKFKDRKRQKPGGSRMADQPEFHSITAHGLPVFRDRTKHLRRQILSLKQAQQVAFLKVGISGQGEQDLFSFFLKKTLCVMPGSNRGHFSAFGNCFAGMVGGHLNSILITTGGNMQEYFLGKKATPMMASASNLMEVP